MGGESDDVGAVDCVFSAAPARTEVVPSQWHAVNGHNHPAQQPLGPFQRRLGAVLGGRDGVLLFLLERFGV
jgi:hypothetical protein